MKIADGTRVGLYEITGTLGSGAMGNVYRAHDPRLSRDVAIKALPEALSGDEDALARFEREARFLAALNHPNIAAIFGIEDVAGERLLILELVPGETLEERLRRGPIPLDESLRVAVQIAGALEAAHTAEIVHRDLKPSNVKVTPEGRVKLLDFGIARQTTLLDEAGHEALSITRSGAIVGTPQYMSPEQIVGESVDRRTDVWSFGCLMFEMLTGRRAFPGRTFFELAEGIQTREPDWTALPRGTPDALRRLLLRCVRKDPRERWHDIGDVHLELEQIQSERAQSSRRMSKLAAWSIGGAAVVVVGLVAALLSARATRAGASDGDTSLRLTQLTSSEGIEQFPAFSPDGASIVYSGEVGGIRKLFVKRLGAADAQQLTSGDHDDVQPAYSADGKRVLFVRARDPHRRLEPGDVFSNYENDAGDVWAIDLASKGEERLVAGAFYPDVSPDGKSIAVDASWAGPRRIWIVDARGLNPQQVTSDSSEAVVHIAPKWSPDGKRIVYQRIERTRFDVAVVDLATRRSTTVTHDVYRKINPVWSADGRMVYYSSDAGGGMNVWRLALDDASRPKGSPQQLTSGAGQDVEIAVSPDGQRIAYTTLHQNADLWRMPMTPAGDVAGPPEQLVATTREDSRGEWSPDGQRIAFNSDRAGPMNLWLYSLADRSTRQITSGPGGDFQPTWSPDGRSLVFFSSREGKADTDIWSVDVTSRQLTRLTRGASIDINPFYSPDGRQIVFQSDASGRLELWVMNADGSGLHQLTTVGAMGHFIRWLPDGFVYFRSESNTGLLRVSPAGGEPQVVSPEVGSHMSFSRDGSRFVDVKGHKAVWLFPVGGASRKIFEFPDADVRIDYPVWSPDGQWLLFDWFKPKEGDLWLGEREKR